MGEGRMKCPDCSGELLKKEHVGGGCRYCKDCGTSWFILKLRKGEKECTPLTKEKKNS